MGILALAIVGIGGMHIVMLRFQRTDRKSSGSGEAPGSHKSIRSDRIGIPASDIADAVFLECHAPRTRGFSFP
jgi:hypothetical protein